MITKNIKGLKKASYVGLTALSIALSLERPTLGADEAEINGRDCMNVARQMVAGGLREVIRQDPVNHRLRECGVPEIVYAARDFLGGLAEEARQEGAPPLIPEIIEELRDDLRRGQEELRLERALPDRVLHRFRDYMNRFKNCMNRCC